MKNPSASITVVIPHRDTPEWLRLAVEMWQRQSPRPFLLIVNTTRANGPTEKVLMELDSQPGVEVARLNILDFVHPCDPICAAMDYAFSRCTTEYLLATHVDMFPKTRKVTEAMLDLCDSTRPVVGWEMSPRGEGPSGLKDGKLSDGFPGHVCTIFHMPTMDRIGAGWSLRRSASVFGTSRGYLKGVKGWPDTETGLGLILRQNGIIPHYLGRETNDENQETDLWLHARSRTDLGSTPRHETAFSEARRRLTDWRREDGDERTIPLLAHNPEPIHTGLKTSENYEDCLHFHGKGEKASCLLMLSLTQSTSPELGRATKETCTKCYDQKDLGPGAKNPVVRKELYARLGDRIRSGGGAAESASAQMKRLLPENAFDIIIPVHNAHDETQRCLESVIRHTSPRHRVLLIDDASTDPRIPDLLNQYASHYAHIQMFRMPKNSGFVATTNWGMSGSSADVVLLNSDTVVTEGWLERLETCLKSDPKIGIVCPLSNNAFVLSVPRNNFPNLLPEGVTPNHYAAALAGASLHEYPEIPTAVGFCMLIRRDVIREIGLFDPMFLEGYGEEMDFSYRARKAGFRVVCADDAFVYHKGGSSFIDPLRSKWLHHRAEQLLQVFWPDYQRELIDFQALDPFARLAERTEGALANLTETVGSQHQNA